MLSHISGVRLFATLWTEAHQAFLSMGFSRQECWGQEVGVAMPSSRRSSKTKDQTCISYVFCIGRWVIYHQHHLGSPSVIGTVRIQIGMEMDITYIPKTHMKLNTLNLYITDYIFIIFRI